MSYERGFVFCEVIFLLRNLHGLNRTFYEAIIIDELVKSPDFLFFVIPAEEGHVVKHPRYPVFSW
jgi:hypothetical protein